MNVNPVAAPGPAPTAQVTTRVEKQVATSPSSRSDLRQQQISLSADADGGAPRPTVGQDTRAASADLQKAEQLRAFIGDDSVRLSTYHDRDSGRSILEVRDETTGDVVSQYPSEELIRLYAALRQSLVDQSA
jgi:flagellar protein FlaG